MFVSDILAAKPLDLNLEMLDNIEAPVDDFTAGFLVGVALVAGVAIGVAIVT